jgi:hypothetical protein
MAKDRGGVGIVFHAKSIALKLLTKDERYTGTEQLPRNGHTPYQTLIERAFVAHLLAN